jgi:hypothetical protein
LWRRSPTIHPRSCILRDEIIGAIARNLFVQAYADFTQREPDGDDVREDLSDLPRPSAGEDWDDHAPETSEAARATARKAAESIERLSDCDLAELFVRATEACETPPGVCKSRTHTAEGLGSYFAMMLTGTGVSWFDDHARFPLMMPSVELHIFSRDELTAEAGDFGQVDERFASKQAGCSVDSRVEL